MRRSYRHISDYENEILEMRQQEKTRKEICEKFGFSLRQVKDFVTRYNQKQKKLSSGISAKHKGRPRKDCSELPTSDSNLIKSHSTV